MPGTKPSFSSSGDQVKIVRMTDRQRELDKLPSPKTRRWVVSRKVQVVSAVRNGVLSLPEACERYHLSEEEFHSWAILLDNHGTSGLRTTRLQDYRQKPTEH
jgi:hypothetical protein